MTDDDYPGDESLSPVVRRWLDGEGWIFPDDDTEADE